MRLFKGFIAVILTLVAFFFANCDAIGANLDTYNSGLLAMKTGNLQEAIDMFSKAISTNPNDYRFYNDRGVAHKRMGNLEGALADYSKALELKPDYTNALNNRGVVYLQQGKYDEALRDFNEALRFGGIEGKIYTNMGIARASKGDHQSAIKDFDIAVSYRPLDYRSFLFMGESLEQIGDKEKAIKMYQVAMGLIREPNIISQLENKITFLEKSQVTSSAAPREIGDQRKTAENLISKRSENTKKPQTVQSSPKREIVLASPSVDSKPTPETPKLTALAPKIENIQQIEKVSLDSALRSFSNPAAEIFKQGLEFFQKSDFHKALVRFEDARQLEKRNRNVLAVAWCQLNICRVYNLMGENTKASESCEQSLKIFNALKAHDEASMALIELGNIKKSAGLDDQASLLYVKASQAATLAGRKIVDSSSHVGSSASKDSTRQISDQTNMAVAAQGNSEKPNSKVLAVEQEKHGDIRAVEPKPNTDLFQQSGPVKNASKQRPVNSTDKIASVGRGPVLWGTDGPRLQTPKNPSSGPNEQNVSARIKNLESKLGPDQLLPENSKQFSVTDNKTTNQSNQNQLTTTVPKQVIGVEALAAVKARDTDLPKKDDKLTRKNRPESNRKVSQKSIDDDLAELKRLRKAGDEKQMIIVLEKLAEKYSRTDQYEKALSALNIALAFREKTTIRQNEEITLNQRGLINERLGNFAQALEDYTRALSTSNPKSKETEKILESKSRSLAGKIGLNVESAMETFKILWLARSTGDISDESKAFYSLAKMYSKAQKFNESLNYFDKSTAALMTDKAKVLEQLGRFEQAQKEMDQALETFKKLDYSQYLNIIRNTKKSDKISRN